MAKPVKRFWAYLLGLLGLYASAASAQSGFLCNPNIVGGNDSKENAGCIDVLSWSWGAATSITGFSGMGPRSASAPSLQNFTMTKQADEASEDLFRHVATGQPVAGVVEYREYPVCTPSCPASEPFLKIRMSNVLLSSFSVGGTQGDQPFESVTLDFEAISYCQRPVGEGGVLGAEQCFAFSRATNKSITPF